MCDKSHVVIKFVDGAECVYRKDQVNLETRGSRYLAAILKLCGAKAHYEISESEYAKLKLELTGYRS